MRNPSPRIGEPKNSATIAAMSASVELIWFTRAAYPYLLTITCPGHATISTGTFPSTHGVFSNQWWDRESGRKVQCSDDPSATNFGYDGPGKDHNSGYRLKVETFADRLRAERSAHVVRLQA